MPLGLVQKNNEIWDISAIGQICEIRKTGNLHKFVLLVSFVTLIAGFDVVLEELDDVFGRGAGQEDFSDTLLLESRQIFLRNDTANKDQDVVHALFPKQLDDAWAECVVSPT